MCVCVLHIFITHPELQHAFGQGLCRVAVDLDNVFWNIDELIHQPLAIDLGENAALVVVPEGAAHRLVVHVGLVLVHAPQLRHGLRVDELEDALITVGPLNEARAVLAVLQELQQKLPQVGRGALAALTLHAHLELRLFWLLQLVETVMLTHSIDAGARRLRLETILEHVRQVVLAARRGRLNDALLVVRVVRMKGLCVWVEG